MLGYIIRKDKEITSFYSLGAWYHRYIRNGKETIFLKKQKFSKKKK